MLRDAIARLYPNDFIVLGNNGGQWLVADEGTAQSVSNKLGITGATPASISTGLVLAVAGYFGRQPTPVWEWIKAKWGSS